jgi:hypothetical protein
MAIAASVDTARFASLRAAVQGNLILPGDPDPANLFHRNQNIRPL